MQKSSLILLALCFLLPLQAQEKAPVSLDATLTLVNQNVWRGGYVAGASLQPEAIVGVHNWQFSVWGSTDFQAEYKEIDLTVKYLWQDLGIGLTDYWFNRQDAPYGKSHSLEANLEYQFRKIPVAVSCNMLVAGENHRFSPYTEASYTPEWKSWKLEFALGFTPWENTMLTTNGFAVTRLSAGVRKPLSVGSSATVESFAGFTYNPDADALFWIAGVSVPF
ncbi:hypothetical protein FACS189432_01780 [Bacteroidia bacterium]|nr:hypothetical protein FACS189426_23870 [Bacteroidia bacterium]GHT26753.1 hypothetical protein FACS189432_01780 [Bacteroidia bacterium]